MASKPKACKYGCGTVITWNESQRFFQTPDGQKHDCRDWDKSQFPPKETTSVVNPQQNYGQNFGGPNPNQQQKDQLISVEIRKNVENQLKHLEAINPNLVAIHSEVSNVCSLLGEVIKKLQGLDESLTVQKIKSGSKQKEGMDNGA